MDIFDEEILKFWRSLQKHNARYIMVGGFAVNLHGYQRFTGDMDLWIEDTSANRSSLRAAFKDYGIGDFKEILTMPIIAGWTVHLPNGLPINLLTSLKGLEAFTFNDSLEMASIATIDDISIPFLHINQIILSKHAVNRPKDQVDIQYLDKIKRLKP